jgi:predicted regulator of Ras-like GTPase activity (Roadblock/LC7/MglB family)
VDAASALADLLEISSQLEAAVVVDGDGSIVAATAAGGERLARTASDLLRTAEERLGRDERHVTQLEVALREGSVFVVRGDGRSIAGRTGPRPASALVLHDLATTLGAITTKRRRKQRETVDA